MSLAMWQVPFMRFVAVGNGRHEADLYLLFCRFVQLSNGVFQEELSASHTLTLRTHTHTICTLQTKVVQTLIHMFACIQTAKNWNIFCFVSVQYSLRQ